MPATRQCPQCGSDLPDGLLEGLCPKCVVRFSLEAPGDAPPSSGPFATVIPKPSLTANPSRLRYFGDYELLEEIARGGMGIVYRARQVSLNRVVAVKMILAGQLATEADIQRFRAEAEAAANLKHPNIVAIHEIGEHEGQRYFSMDFIEGQSLAALVRDAPLPAQRAARYVQIVAEAIHYAHQRGTLHRDLKPSNVIINANDQPQVTDFGLAKRLKSDSELTLTGQVLGSPNYMPPEQATAKHGQLGSHSDVYSLGAILYHLVTGRPPFNAESVEETLTQVVNRDPVAPRLLNPNVQRDLDTICLKCLEKEPARRYQTASEVADELGRYLRTEPIHARPVSRSEKLWRWRQRNPRLADALAGLVLVFIVGFAGVLWQWRRASHLAEQNRDRLVRSYVANATRLMDEGDMPASMLLLSEAMRLDRNDPEREKIHRLRLGAVLSRCPKLLQVFDHGSAVIDGAFSPAGDRVITAGSDNTAQVWDAVKGTPLTPRLEHGDDVVQAAFSPDGTRVVTASLDKTARIWDATTGSPLAAALKHPVAVKRAEFSFDGRRIVSACGARNVSGEARVWNADTGDLIAAIKQNREVQYASFNPDGTQIVTGNGSFDGSGTVQIWNAATGEAISQARTVGQAVLLAAFSPNGKHIVTASGQWFEPSSARVWDGLLTQSMGLSLPHDGGVFYAAFSPDSRRVASASYDRTARVWDPATGKPLTPPLRHNAIVTKIKFSPDSRWVLTICQDSAVRVWDAVTGEPAGLVLHHSGEVRNAEFSSNGRQVLTVGDDHLARLWDMSAADNSGKILYHPGGIIRHGTFSPDARRVITVSYDATARIWDASDVEVIGVLKPGGGILSKALYSPDGQRILTTSFSGRAQLWNATTFQADTPALVHSQAIYHAAFSSDSHRVVTASWDKSARVWDAIKGTPLTPPLPHPGWLLGAAFSPDGERVLTTSGTDAVDCKVHIWDVSTGTEVPLSIVHGDQAITAAYSPDGKRIISTSVDQTAQIWDAATGQRVTPALRHNGRVDYAAFSPESRRVVTASFDATARVWDANTGAALTPPLPHKSRVLLAGFSPDGRLVLTASADYTVRVWDAATGEAVSPPLIHGMTLESAEFSPTGRQIVSTCYLRTAHVWDLPESDLPPVGLRNLAQYLAGQKVGAAGEVIPLTAGEVQSLGQSLRSNYPEQCEVSSQQALSWHRKQAEADARDREWFAALFHLDRLVQLRPKDASILEQRTLAYRNVEQIQVLQTQRIPPRDPRAKPHQIDLTTYYNAILTQSWHPVGRGGNFINDLASLPRGLQSLAGVEFDVRGIVQLQGAALKDEGGDFPEHLDGIKVRQCCQRIHFLHATGYYRYGLAEGAKIGSYLINYANQSQMEIPIRYGEEVRDWWRLANEPAEAKNLVEAWTGTNQASEDAGVSVRLFRTTWQNPLPELEIISIDYLSAMTEAAPFLIAITAEP